MANVKELEEAAKLLEATWLERRDSVDRAQKREAKAKAAYFTAYEAYVVARKREEASNDN